LLVWIGPLSALVDGVVVGDGGKEMGNADADEPMSMPNTLSDKMASDRYNGS
jgi:hypothetical protein